VIRQGEGAAPKYCRCTVGEAGDLPYPRRDFHRLCSIGGRRNVLPTMDASARDPSVIPWEMPPYARASLRYPSRVCPRSAFAIRVDLVPDQESIVWTCLPSPDSKSSCAGHRRGGSAARLGARAKGGRPAASTDSDGSHQASHLTWDAPSLPTLSIATILPPRWGPVNRLLRGLAVLLRPAMVATAPSAPLKRHAGRLRSRRTAIRTAPLTSWSQGGGAMRETVPRAGIRLVPAVSRR